MAVTTGENTKHLAAAAEYVENVFVQGISVHGMTTIGHECKVTDDTGYEFFHHKATVANGGAEFFLTVPKFFRKLTAATLTSGEVTIYLV